jgi:hypothetical protein
MKTIKLHQNSRNEDKYIYPFLKFLYKNSKRNIKYDAILVNPPQKTPDYHVSPTNDLVEIKEIHDKADLERHVKWSRIADRLRKTIEQSKNINKVKGAYIIDTPSSFNTSREKSAFQKAASTIITAIINNKQKVTVLKQKFTITKISDDGPAISFSNNSGGSYNPAQTIHENICIPLENTNKQLAYNLKTKNKKDGKKILLLVNKYYLLRQDWDLFNALSFSIKQLRKYKNIDEVWFQEKTKDNNYDHKLLYTKKFIQEYYQGNLKLNEINTYLFSNWFKPLSKIDNHHKDLLFTNLKKLLKTKKPHQVFCNSLQRSEMVRLGSWLAEEKRFEDIVWLIERFIGDPSPKEPKKYNRELETNYHKQILNGEDPHVITSVLGHLTWTIQNLANRKDKKNKKYVVKALNFTQKLVNHNNYYIKLQTIIPLIEIAKRRQWLIGWRDRPRKGEYKKFHQTVFQLVKLVENEPKCIAIAKWLTNVFTYYKDLSTKEAIRILDALKITEESASLFMYYGIYRKNHYTDQKTNFNSKKLENKLRKLIQSKTKKDESLKAGIIWHFWKILNENSEEFSNIKNWIFLTLKQSSKNKMVYSNLLRIIEDWIEKEPNTCIIWFNRLITIAARENNTNKKARNFWLTTNTGKLLQITARHNPKKIIGIVKKIVRLWKLGSFVGSPKEIFESFEVISNIKLKNSVKKQFKVWYKEMKKINPKLELVNWKL